MMVGMTVGSMAHHSAARTAGSWADSVAELRAALLVLGTGEKMVAKLDEMLVEK